jgi:preprotein translocase subunit YajC
MPTTIASIVYGLVGRAIPYLVALQDAPRLGGGSSGTPAAHPVSGAGGASGGGAAGALGSFVMPMALMAFVFIFMVMGPARKQKKETETLQKSLQKGDKVVTTSQMIGTVVGLDDQFATIEISEKVRVKFLREAIARKLEINPAPVVTGKPAEAKK